MAKDAPSNRTRSHAPVRVTPSDSDTVTVGSRKSVGGLTTRKTKQQVQPEEDERPDFDDFFGPGSVTLVDSESYSEDSDWTRPSMVVKKKTPKITTAAVATSPVKPLRLLPTQSDSEPEEDPVSASLPIGAFSDPKKFNATQRQIETKKRTITAAKPAIDSTIPGVIQLKLDLGNGQASPIINLDVSSLVLGKRTAEQAGLQAVTSATARGFKRPKVTSAPLKRKAKKGADTKGFADLPYEIRVRIYRLAFVTEEPIDFASRKGFCRSSALLQTCKMAAAEGTGILYGENAFHLEKTSRTTGKYWDAELVEIGWKDVRRFLEAIGSTNIAKMQYLSFVFADAAPSGTRELDEYERRFVNDPVLIHCLNLLSVCTLDKIAFSFLGRKQLAYTDLYFLRAITSIKTRSVHFTKWHNGPNISKVSPGVIEKLQKLMVVPKSDDNIDETKKKVTVKMFHERPGKQTWLYYDD